MPTTTLHLLCAGAAQGLVTALQPRLLQELTAQTGGRFGAVGAMKEAFAAGDVATAQMWQERANTTVNIMNDARFGGQGLAISRLMYEWKGAVRLGPPRAPFSPLTPPQQKALEEELKRVGFFQWCDGGFEPREVKARV